MEAPEDNDGWSSAEELINSSDAEEEGGVGLRKLVGNLGSHWVLGLVLLFLKKGSSRSSIVVMCSSHGHCGEGFQGPEFTMVLCHLLSVGSPSSDHHTEGGCPSKGIVHTP